MNAPILPALRTMETESMDLIYSRHVLEQHSIEARILLQHPGFKSAIRNNQFDDLPESFPASRRNIQAVFKECQRILKPSGASIVQVAKKKYGVLSEATLQAYEPRELQVANIGRYSELIMLVK